jgi:iron complex outermembrane recepter protein
MSNNNSYNYGRFKKTLLAASIMAIGSAAYAAEPSKGQGAIEEDDEQIEEIVVTGRRQAIEAASDIKKNSDTMVDAVVADEAGRLPDNSITEVLQRIPGITMSRWRGDGAQFLVEGSGIQVRGLSSAGSLLNGREIFGANGGGGLSWGEVTPELMAAVDVYKASRADMIEGGTGGTINLRTKMPFDFDGSAVNGALGLSYADLVDDIDGSSSVLGSTRFDTPIGEMGILVDVAYSKRRQKNSHLSIEPSISKYHEGEQRYIARGFGWGDDNFERERGGFYEAFQWRPTENLEIFQTAFTSDYTSSNNGTNVAIAADQIMPRAGTGTVFDSNGVLIQADEMGYSSVGVDAGSTAGQTWLPEDQQVDCNTPYGGIAMSLQWSSPIYCAVQNANAGTSRSFNASENATTDLSQGFTWNASDRLRVKGALQYVYSTAKNSGLTANISVPLTTYSMDLRGEVPKFIIADSVNYNTRGSYNWDSMAWRPSDNVARMWAPNLDVDFDLGDGFFKTVSAGVRYASRHEDDTYDGNYWSPLGNSWDGWAAGQQQLDDGPEADSEFYVFDNFFHDRIAVPNNFYVPSEQLLRSQDYSYLLNTYGYNVKDPVASGLIPTTPYEALHHEHGKTVTDVDTTAVYLQTSFGSEEGLLGIPYTGNFGVRYVRTDTQSTGSFVFDAGHFYMTQADADADFREFPVIDPDTDNDTPRAVRSVATVDPRSNEVSDSYLLPSLNLNFKPLDSVFVRFAANQSMQRPSFNDIAVSGDGRPVTIANTNNHTETDEQGAQTQITYLPIYNGLSANTGNTLLKPTLSTNFDLAFEWYGNGDAAHLSIFHKSLKDFIYYDDVGRPLSYEFLRDSGGVLAGEDTLQTAQSVNSKDPATIQGVEFGGRTFFDKLPGLWSGFGIDTNFTFIDSHNPGAKAFDVDGNRFENIPVTGLSEFSYNVQLMYQKGRFYAGLAYNWRSRFLQSTNTHGTGTYLTTYKRYTDEHGTSDTLHYQLPLYGSAYGQWDFGMNYQITDNFKIYLNANNLTNEIAKSEMEILPGKFYARNFYESDRRVDFGVNFNF